MAWTYLPDTWEFDPESGYIRDENGWVLATVPHAIAGDVIDRANGRLMAAAPLLLRALKAVYEAGVTDDSLLLMHIAFAATQGTDEEEFAVYRARLNDILVRRYHLDVLSDEEARPYWTGRCEVDAAAELIKRKGDKTLKTIGGF